MSKERDTLVRFFGWAAASGYVQCSPAASLTKVKGSGDLPPFRTRPEIEALIARGGLGRKEAWSLWDTLYLSPEDIAGVLALVRSRARREVSFLLHALPAYTGMRRGEVMRLRWADVEFD